MTHISRRHMMRGAAGLPLAAVLADPMLARAAASGLETVSIATKGGLDVSAALALPARTPAPAVVLIHEWWGLNDQIKSVTAEYATLGYAALAVDLMKGEVASNPDEARAQAQAVDDGEATDTMASWIGWFRAHAATTGRLGTVGWCFGGAWSLNASIAAPVDATVIYYGRVARNAEDLRNLQGPVLGHFATRDRWINEEMVGTFEQEMAKAGKSLTVHWYEADHAFANPSGGRYDQEDAALAWTRTKGFFKTHLG